MENKKFKTNIKSLIFALVLLVGISFATAQGVWNDATNTPGDNSGIFSPITDGPEPQEKEGMLISSGILNNSGAMISYADVSVGFYDINIDYRMKTPAYFFGDTYFQKNKAMTGNEGQLCVDPQGKVKICHSVEFKSVAPVYYTNTGVTSYPSSGVTGYVSHKIGSGLSCTTGTLSGGTWTGTSGTDWSGGQTLSGINANKAVKFNGWGNYDLKITCDGVVYTTSIKIGGKVIPTASGSITNYTLNLGASRTATIQAIGAGGSGAKEYETNGKIQCTNGFDGSSTYIKIGSTSILNAGGGGGAVAGRTSGCTPKAGSAGSVNINSLSASYSNNGYDGRSGYYQHGGCNGMPDSNNNLNNCNNTGGSTLPYGIGGSGKGSNSYGAGGGGGAYITGTYTLPATGTLTTFVGAGGGNNRGLTPTGQNGYISITW